MLSSHLGQEVWLEGQFHGQSSVLPSGKLQEVEGHIQNRYLPLFC